MEAKKAKKNKVRGIKNAFIVICIVRIDKFLILTVNCIYIIYLHTFNSWIYR